ncbi:MAG: hypothetical protein RLZZ502_554 [Pseudomonadota bacterium]
MSGQSKTVGAFLADAKSVIEQGLPLQWIRGEISGLKLAASGHRYFDLKDATAQVACVLYKFKAARATVALREGLELEVLALPSIYEPRGSFQVMVEGVRPAGLGAQHEAFLQLKAKLTAEGLFDSARKRSMPGFVRSIGIITSASGAVIHDICTTARSRWPGITLVLYPALVQGASAAESLVAALELANQRSSEEVLVIARGGGSAEDLNAFNEEALVRAVAASRLPVVSAVGHETDVSLCDFAADLRAPTPTAAASMLTPNARLLTQKIDECALRLQHALKQKMQTQRWRVQQLMAGIRHPMQGINEARRRLRELRQGLPLMMRQHMQAQQYRLHLARKDLLLDFNAPRARLWRVQDHLHTAYRQALVQQQKRLHLGQAALQLLAPDAVLARGYAWVSNSAGVVVGSVAQVVRDEAIYIQLKDGQVKAVVT